MSDETKMAQELDNIKKREEIRADLVEKFPDVAVRGKIDLFAPIVSRDVPVNVLHYDFDKLNSEELVVALDGDPRAAGLNGKISNRQAMLMFALACEKAERPISGIDSRDVLERLSPRDVITATRVSRTFFTTVLGVALMSISEM